MYIYLLISTILGTVIGWLTNVLAVKLIFRPLKQYKLFGIIPFQGLIPKRRSQIATAIGETVEMELLSKEDLFNSINSSDLQEKLNKTITANIKNRLKGFFPAWLPSSLTEQLFLITDSVIESEVKTFFRQSLPKLTDDIKDMISIATIVEEKINQLDIRELEKMVFKIAQRELKHIEYLGGVIGFIIGLIQGLIFILLTH